MNWIRHIFRRTPNVALPEPREPPFLTTEQTTPTSAGDSPIATAAEDLIGRAPLAQNFAIHVLGLDASRGLVVGVLGPWGSGKTSLVNLARAVFHDRGVPVVDFNPWMFSGTDQLVDAFFVELSAQLKIRSDTSEIGVRLEEYGDAFAGLNWLPILGPWVERSRMTAKMVGALMKRRKEGISGRRIELATRLSQLRTPIVVVVDDVDRLTTDEIRAVFKLVRLTASFPNIIYVVAFDRARVEQALSEDGIPGRAYLEKILQVAIDIPAIPEHVLATQLLAAIDAALAGIPNPGPFSEQTWPDVFMEVVRPLVGTMRDVRRYSAAVPYSVNSLKGELSLVDVLALEAVRVFLPDVFKLLPQSIDGLTKVSGWGDDRRDPPHLKAQIEALIAASGDNAPVVRNLIKRVFPAAERHVGGTNYGGLEWPRKWLIERRTAHEDFLRLYLEGVFGEGLEAFSKAERAWKVFGDEDELAKQLASVPREQLKEIISALEAYENEYRSEHVLPTSIVLMNLIHELPDRQLGMFDFDPKFAVTRVVYRLLRKLTTPAEVEEAVQAILPKLQTLYAKVTLITIVGHREGQGHQLISEGAATALERAWAEEVCNATAAQLATEPDLLRMLLRARESAPEAQRPLPTSAAFTLAVIRSARTEVRSQSMDSRVVRRSARLVWNHLAELYGDEPALLRAIDGLQEENLPGSDDLLDLSARYAAGWRPGDFGDDD